MKTLKLTVSFSPVWWLFPVENISGKPPRLQSRYGPPPEGCPIRSAGEYYNVWKKWTLWTQKQMSQSDYVKFWNTGKKVSFKFNILKTLAPHSTLRSLIRFLWSPLTFYPCLLPSYPFLNLRIKMNTLIFAVLSAVLIFSNSCLQVSVKFWSFSFFRYSTSGWPSAFFTKTSS